MSSGAYLYEFNIKKLCIIKNWGRMLHVHENLVGFEPLI